MNQLLGCVFHWALLSARRGNLAGTYIRINLPSYRKLLANMWTEHTKVYGVAVCAVKNEHDIVFETCERLARVVWDSQGGCSGSPGPISAVQESFIRNVRKAACKARRIENRSRTNCFWKIGSIIQARTETMNITSFKFHRGNIHDQNSH